MIKLLYFWMFLGAVATTVVRADECTDACEPPACIPSGTNFPFSGNGSMADSPQMILIVFEGSLNEATYSTYYAPLFDGIANPNGCPALGSFFFDHKYTDYTTVRKAWSVGHDAGAQSITGTIWNSGSAEDVIYNEIAGEKYYLQIYSMIPDVPGTRGPNGNSAGNNQFQAVSTAGFKYDVTLTSRAYKNPYWPYTLDCTTTQDCTTGPCPTDSFPGLYEFPVTDLVDGNGVLCANLAGCIYNNTMNNAYNLLSGNFEYHKGQLTPFVLPVPLTWLYDGNNTAGLRQFLTEGVGSGYFVVTFSQAVAWLKDPVTVAELGTLEDWNCDVPRPTDCNILNCKYNVSSETINMNFCSNENATTCPGSYPWVDNLPWLGTGNVGKPVQLVF